MHSLNLRFQWNRLRAPMPGDYDLPTDLKRVIIWTQSNASALSQKDNASWHRQGWELKKATEYTIQDCWIWADLLRYQRQVYVRTNQQ